MAPGLHLRGVVDREHIGIGLYRTPLYGAPLLPLYPVLPFAQYELGGHAHLPAWLCPGRELEVLEQISVAIMGCRVVTWSRRSVVTSLTMEREPD